MPELPETPSNGNVLSATPLDTDRKRGPVAKRRFQKGSFQVKNGMAYSFYYEDAQQPDGSLESRRVRHTIGRIGEGGLSERAARREHDRIMQAINDKRGSVAPAVKGKTFEDCVKAWRKAIAPNLSPSTVRQYESYLRSHILPKFKDEAPHTLTVGALQQFATDLRATLSRKTVANVVGAVFSILSYAERCGIFVAKASFRDLELGTQTNGGHSPFFTSTEAQKIISASWEPYRTLFTVAWLTGLRAGELLALKVNDLDFENKTIRVDESSDDHTRQIRQPKTEKSIAVLPMPKALEEVLAAYLRDAWRSNPSGFLFPNPKGDHPMRRTNLVRTGLKPVLEGLGIATKDTGLHAFRRGLATALAQQSVPIPDLQKQMRHADVQTTLRVYCYSIPATQRSAMESVGAALSIGTKVPIGTRTAN